MSKKPFLLETKDFPTNFWKIKKSYVTLCCNIAIILNNIQLMCTRERALELGQTLEKVEAAEREIAAYEKEHGKPMNKTMQAVFMLSGLVEVYDKSLYL